ncbi:MAG: MiaB/RimO family radical SAM methylthiotransferase, partial [Synergistaceae bacterium]|nr:MiaB/RimO family radical SAM methylthiotransferase [Synergistaceae bacterium]
LSEKAVIAVCGCWAQNISREEALSLGIAIVAGNRRKALLPALMARALGGEGPSFVEEKTDVLRCDEWDGLSLSSPLFHTRAFVKVQDGCNHFCSYCIIPFVRGKPVSRDGDDVVAEVRRLAASGCPEVVLTGVHLGLYGSGGSQSLAELVARVASVEGIKRIRFGSLEPFGLDGELMDALAGSPKFCRHLHLPLQSGSPSVLSRMRRGYSPEDFLELVRMARSRLGDDLHISTDVLVGFPGETDREFEETLRFMEECRFGKVHVFPYSPREGTEAWSLPDRVVGEKMAERTAQALHLAERLLTDFAGRKVGHTVAVLAEEAENGGFRGLTPSFLRVEGEGSAVKGEEVPVKISGIKGENLKGRRAS